MTDQEMEDLDSKLVVSIFFSQYSKRFFKTKTGTISCNSKISFTFYEMNLALYYLLNYIGISINQIFNFFIQVFLSSIILISWFLRDFRFCFGIFLRKWYWLYQPGRQVRKGIYCLNSHRKYFLESCNDIY